MVQVIQRHQHQKKMDLLVVLVVAVALLLEHQAALQVLEHQIKDMMEDMVLITVGNMDPVVAVALVLQEIMVLQHTVVTVEPDLHLMPREYR